MYRYTILSICLALLVFNGCVHKTAPAPVAPVSKPVAAEEDATEELDKELTETWPDVGEVELTDAERAALESKLEIPYPLDEVSARVIQGQFIFLVRKVPRTVRTWVARSSPFIEYIREEFRSRGLPMELAYLPFIESGFNPLAYSRVGAAGIWQFMAATGRKFGLRRDMWVDERRDPFKATKAAADYLTRLHELVGDWTLAIASYNAGEAKIMKAMEATGAKNFFELQQRNNTLNNRLRLRKETLEFVPRLLAIAKLINNLESLGFNEPDTDGATKLVRIDVGPRVDLKALARECGMSWKDFRNYNPAFRRTGTPPSGKFSAMIPATKVSQAREFLSKPQPKLAYDGLEEYTVRKGDSWSRIAARAGTSVKLIKEANNSSSNMLRPGQMVFVPTSSSSLGKNSPKNKLKIPPGATTYKVKPGDTLSEIADSTLVPVKVLLRANNMRSPKSLRAGQTLVIPMDKAVAPRAATPPSSHKSGGAPYVVKPGETLSHIADRTLVPVEELLKANNMSSARSLRAGQSIIIPLDKAKQPAPEAKPAPVPVSDNAAGKKSQSYQVQKGDTLWSLARRFKVKTSDLMRWNSLGKNAVLRPGDEIRVYK